MFQGSGLSVLFQKLKTVERFRAWRKKKGEEEGREKTGDTWERQRAKDMKRNRATCKPIEGKRSRKTKGD